VTYTTWEKADSAMNTKTRAKKNLTNNNFEARIYYSYLIKCNDYYLILKAKIKVPSQYDTILPERV